MSRQRIVRRGRNIAAGAAFATIALAGCAIVDKYSERAIDYNLQAEKTQTQNLLLNVIRASLRRPMQFTGLTSISGNATASGSVSGGYINQHQTPFQSLFGIPATGTINPAVGATTIARSVSGTGTGTAALSGGQTFTVPVLDTQEFYRGILSPLSPQIVDYYVQQGYPPEILFDLFVNSVEMIATDSPNCDRFTFRNDVRNDLRFTQFQALGDYLLSSGFTTEHVADSIPYGPAIAKTSAPLDAADAAKMLEAYSKASAAGLDIHSEGDAYRLQKRTSHYRFCFAITGDQRPTWLGNLTPDAYCGSAATARSNRRTTQPRPNVPVANHCPQVVGAQGSGEAGSSQFFGIILSPVFLDRIRRTQEFARTHGNVSYEDYFPIDRFRGKHVTFKFQLRSVEGILYYLGEITRQQLNPEFDAVSRVTQVKTGLHYSAIPHSECNPHENGGTQERKHDLIRLTRGDGHDPRSYTCENLFVLEAGPAPDAFYSVYYDGTTYSIPNDPARAGRSLQVLELVKQLLALYTSAKDLPQTSVISIIGGTAQ
ncbi:MAG TPA: hypothetical protein VMH84_11385 [Xanthobacteraceae bacterium]|nr:hypothetical protein [Xanthobacteraceae bacterium]